MELPTTVETVEAAIKKHKDFTTTMELNLHRIKAVIEAGESLISQSNIYSERIRERIDTLANRYHIQSWKVMNKMTNFEAKVLKEKKKPADSKPYDIRPGVANFFFQRVRLTNANGNTLYHFLQQIGTPL